MAIREQIEKGAEFAAIAEQNIQASGVGQKIKLFHADALEYVSYALNAESFDIVFIDGDKEHYADYFMKTSGMVRSGGLVIIDDALFHGDVLNAIPATKKGAGVKRALSLAAGMGWERLLLPLANGMMILVKP